LRTLKYEEFYHNDDDTFTEVMLKAHKAVYNGKRLHSALPPAEFEASLALNQL
jgi:hypothetical protein